MTGGLRRGVMATNPSIDAGRRRARAVIAIIIAECGKTYILAAIGNSPTQVSCSSVEDGQATSDVVFAESFAIVVRADEATGTDIR